jgi:hypothetical protein
MTGDSTTGRIGKTTFHLVALDEHGKIAGNKKFSRKQLLAYTANGAVFRVVGDPEVEAPGQKPWPHQASAEQSAPGSD